MSSSSINSGKVPLTQRHASSIADVELHNTELRTSKSDQIILKRLRSTVICGLLVLAAISYGLFFFGSSSTTSLFSHINAPNFSILGRKHALGDYFLGIRYAIGHPLMRPKLYTPTGQIRATDYFFACATKQIAHVSNCPYLNIYRCNNSHSYKLPVAVYFTAGDAQSGSLSDFVPSVVIKQYACRGVMIVYVNYHVNMSGFFSTGLPGSGNMALYEAKLALEWVRMYIGNFGGNNRDITVIGTAMGARIVSLLGRIPRSRHLYQKAILLSGSSFVPYMVQDFAHGQHASRHFAFTHKCANEQNWPLGKVPKHPQQVIKCLRKTNTTNVKHSIEKNFPPWNFIIDDDLVGPDLADPTNMIGLSVPLLTFSCHEKPLSPSHKIPMHTIRTILTEIKQLKNRQFKPFREYYASLFNNASHAQNRTISGTFIKEIEKSIIDDFLVTGPTLMEVQATAERNMPAYYVNVYGRKPSTRLGSNTLCLGDSLFNRLSLKHWLSTQPLNYDSYIADLIINFIKTTNPQPFTAQPQWPIYSPLYPEGVIISGITPSIVSVKSIPSAAFWLCKIAYDLFEISHLIEICNDN